MPITKKDIQYSVGIEDLFLCFMLEETTSDLPTFEPEVYEQTNITDLTISTTQSSAKKYASNKMIINVSKNTNYGLAFNLAGLDRVIKDKMFGKTRTRGISFDKAIVKENVKLAVGVVFPLNDGTKVARWYPRCTVTPADESWQTQNEELVINDTAYTITADPLLFNNVTYVELDTGSVDAAGITVEQFMSQVVCDESQIETLFPTGTTGTSGATVTEG